jgi:hypothetical protein
VNSLIIVEQETQSRQSFLEVPLELLQNTGVVEFHNRCCVAYLSGRWLR